jgi:alcohol dehydrogenase class IV
LLVVEALYARNTNPIINMMALEGIRALASQINQIYLPACAMALTPLVALIAAGRVIVRSTS